MRPILDNNLKGKISPLICLHLLNMQAITDKMVFPLPDFMASPEKKKIDQRSRPRPLHSKSFTRVGTDHSTRVSRANTLPNGITSETVMADNVDAVVQNNKAKRQPDAFERTSENEDNEVADEGSGKLPDDFDELPIELVSLSDRFVLHPPFQADTNISIASSTHYLLRFTQHRHPSTSYPHFSRTFMLLLRLILALIYQHCLLDNIAKVHQFHR